MGVHRLFYTNFYRISLTLICTTRCPGVNRCRRSCSNGRVGRRLISGRRVRRSTRDPTAITREAAISFGSLALNSPGNYCLTLRAVHRTGSMALNITICALERVAHCLTHHTRHRVCGWYQGYILALFGEQTFVGAVVATAFNRNGMQQFLATWP